MTDAINTKLFNDEADLAEIQEKALQRAGQLRIVN